MNHSKRGERSISKNSTDSGPVRPHPPNEPPINASKRPIQSSQFLNEENEIENADLSSQIESNENIQNNENEENDDDNTINNLSKSTNEKETDDSWLNNLPPVIHPDEELHQELMKKRHEERLKKVTSICHCELEGILNFSFECINRRIEEKKKEEIEIKKGKNRYRRNEKKEELERYEKARQTRVLRTKFRNGFFTPEIVHIQRDPELLSTFVEPFHTIAIQHYLHFLSHSYLSDLSFAFNVSISESHLEDPNPLFNKLIQEIYNSSEKFTKSFGTIGSLKFPFIVCVGGPVGGGRTTITQFLQKVFDAHIIQLKPIVQPGSQSKKKKGGASPPPSPKVAPADGAVNENPVPEVPTDFFLNSSIQIKYSDDKTAVQQIVQGIKDNMDGRGFIIDGYPNNKNQFASLEKELSSAGLNMKKEQESLKERIGSQRLQNAKAQFPSINGMIIALNNEENTERLVDPQTGNIYKPDFNMPGIADLIGVSPVLFQKVKNDIEDRLIKVTVPPISIIPPKQLQVYTQYEGIVRKTATCTIIKHCDNLKDFIECIDNFILSLFSKLPNVLPHKRDKNNVITDIFPPLSILTQPSFLVLPQQCYAAVETWFNCLDLFGKTIANQSNLVNTLDNKLDVIIKRAIERFQLLIGQKDERLNICDEFVKKNMNNNDGNYNLPQLFRTIWDLSLKIRNKNLEHVDEVVAKSGLVEVLLELKESPKTFFIALVQKMLYMKWFYDSFEHLIYGKKEKEEDKNVNEEENVNEKPEGNEEQSEKEKEKPEEEEKEEEKKDKKEDKKSNKRESKLSKGKQSKQQKEKEKKGKNDKKQERGKSKSKNSKRGKDTESQKDIENEVNENENSDVKKVIEEPFLDKLTNINTIIPEFSLKMNPNSIPPEIIQEPIEIEEEELPSQIEENDQNENSNNDSNVPTIDISIVNKTFHPRPNSARPVHPPDSIRGEGITNRNSELKSQRADFRKVTFKNDLIDDEIQTEAENRFKEQKSKADFHGFDYLLTHLNYFYDSSKPSNSQVMFDVNVACSYLNIPPCVMKTPFDDTYRYAVEFFTYIGTQFKDDLLLSNEVKSNISIFRRFMNLCNTKETTMVKSVFDLRDALTRYAYAKCTHEMEHFASQFRLLKKMLNLSKEEAKADEANLNEPVTKKVNFTPKGTQKTLTQTKNITKSTIAPTTKPSIRSPRRTFINRNADQNSPRQNKLKTIKNSIPINNSNININTISNVTPIFSHCFKKLNGPLFEFDIKHVNPDVQKLAKLELSLDTPIIAQDLVSSETLMKIASCASDLGIYHASGYDMLLVAHEVIFGIEEEEEEEAAIDEEEEKTFVYTAADVIGNNDDRKQKLLMFMKFQFCMNILECAEHFEVLQFLLCFAHSREEEIEIMEMFQNSMIRNPSTKPLSRSINLMSTVHDDNESINIFHQNDINDNESLNINDDNESEGNIEEDIP
ncbi:hypothetical protein M9Y10_001069 [Tritrichomonas musculus]|uniref:Uncharacterized protein n=1 Tax=Tritrichomonas musculus TaxID=1915356 RepID=A0ABR2L614_9EUKA